jgi:signal transduction histidine kinase
MFTLTPERRRLLLRLGQAGALLVMAILGVTDIGTGLASGGNPFVVLQILSAVATAAVWLPRHRQGSTALAKGALALAVGSLVLTVLVAIAHSADGTQGSFGTAEALGLLGVLFVVSRRAGSRWAVGAVVALVAAVGLLALRGGLSADFIIVGMALGMCAGGVTAAGVWLRTVESSRARAMENVRAEQRAEFARDLHDFIAHHVTGIVVQAQGAKFIAEQDPKRALLALEQIEQAGAETMASMRRMVGVLRDPEAKPDAPLTPLAGVDEVGPLLEQFSSAGSVPARLHVDGDLAGLPVEVSTSAYRVVMEALTNARQHALTARVVDVWVRRTPDWLLVRVANDGPAPRAATPRDRPGYGLVGLTERVRAIGGRITAGPGIEGGWVLDAALPLNGEVSG